MPEENSRSDDAFFQPGPQLVQDLRKDPEVTKDWLLDYIRIKLELGEISREDLLEYWINRA